MTDDEVITLQEFARESGKNTSLLARWARDGLVQGAKHEARPGSINPPWVARRSAWLAAKNQERRGRPKKGS